MSHKTLRFHLVDGKVSARFSSPLNGRQFAELYKFVNAPTTKREFGEALERAAKEWGLKVEVELSSR